MIGGGGACGSFLLFAAFALLLVSTISSPIFPVISFLDIVQGGARTTFGVFGYCIGGAQCSPRQLGYNLPVISQSLGAGVWSNDNIVRLTRALVLHPVAAGLAFIAFIVALLSDRFGYLFSSFISLLAFLVSLVAMAVDFAIFTIVRNQVNNNSTGLNGASASFANAIWLTLAATIILFFATFVVCFSCCTARRKERYAGNGYGGGRFGNRY